MTGPSSKPPISSQSAKPPGRFRRWSLSKSKDKRAQDQHFVRTNSGRWIKTEHPLISTDDEDDEARRRHQELANDQDGDGNRPMDFRDPQHAFDHDEQRADLDPQVSIPPWHASRTPMQWNPYPPTNDPQSSTSPVMSPKRHRTSQSQPQAFFGPPSSSSSSSNVDILSNVHNPPAPVPFPMNNYQPSPRKNDDPSSSKRMKYKPGSLYPLHNSIRPPLPYYNYHLRPPELGLPPIFTPAGYAPHAGVGAGKATVSQTTDHSGSGQAGVGSGGSERDSPMKEASPLGGKNHPPTTGPPQNLLQAATSAILGHAMSHQSLARLARSPSSGNVAGLQSPDYQGVSPGEPSHGFEPSGQDDAEMDLADAWGTSFLHSSPYDLGRAPLGKVSIPAFQLGQHQQHQHGFAPPPLAELFSPRKFRGHSPGGPNSRSRSRRPSAEPSGGRPSIDLHLRPRSRSPSPTRPSSAPASPIVGRNYRSLDIPQREIAALVPEKSSHTPEKPYQATMGGRIRKISGLKIKALFSGSASHLPSLAGGPSGGGGTATEEGFVPRLRKRTISLGQTGLGLGIPASFSRATGAMSGMGRTRKQSFEVVRKPTVRTQAPPPEPEPESEPERAPEREPELEREPERSRSREREEQPLEPKHVSDKEELVTSPTGQQSVIPFPSSPGEPTQPPLHPHRPLLDPNPSPRRRSSGRSSKEIGRSLSASGQRPVISGPMPLRKSPSTASMTTSIRDHKRSTSQLGHSVLDGIGDILAVARAASLTRSQSHDGTVDPIPTPPRGRKPSRAKKPPRTLHRYAPNMQQFDAMYSARPSMDGYSDQDHGVPSSPSGTASGMLNKISKKLSWVTRSSREREVEERMKAFEKERALDRKLELAREKAMEGHTRAYSEDLQRPPPDLLPELDLGGGSPMPRFSQIDAKSPTFSARKSLNPQPANTLDGLIRPASEDAMSPFGKLASLMSPKTTTPAISPMALYSPRREPSNSNLANLNTPAALASTTNLDSTRPPSRQRRGSAASHMRGPSPVPPRPMTPPERQESPLPLPRMALTIMNPDSPSPPTPAKDFSPGLPSPESSPSHGRSRGNPLAVPSKLGRPERETRRELHPSQQHGKIEGRTSRQEASDLSETDDQRALTRYTLRDSTPPSDRRDSDPQLRRPLSHQAFSPAGSQMALMSPASAYQQSVVSYAIAPPAPDSLAAYSPQSGMAMHNGLMNTVSVMMVQNGPYGIPSMYAQGTPMPTASQLYQTPYSNPHILDSNSSVESPTEMSPVKGSTHAVYTYEPAPPVRPVLPAQYASDPLSVKPAGYATRPSNLRRETISALGKQWEVIPGQTDPPSSHDRRQSGSDSKSRRRTSARHGAEPYSSQVIVEDIRQMDGLDSIRDKERKITREREYDRERAREKWDAENTKERERQAAKEERRLRRTMSKEAKENDRHRERQNGWSSPPPQEFEYGRDRHERVLRKPTRSSTLSSTFSGVTMPPTPPPKSEQPAKPSKYSSSSEQAEEDSRHVRRHTRDSSSPQGPALPSKPAKVFNTPSQRSVPSQNSPYTYQELDRKPLPRPSSDDSDDAKVGTRAAESWAKDRFTKGANAMDPILSPNPGMPFSPAMSMSAHISPHQSPAPSSMASIPGFGSAYTSFSVHSPFMAASGVAQRDLSYVPAPPARDSNPLPRPPRDISLDLKY